MDLKLINSKRERYLELTRELKEVCAWLDKNDKDLQGYSVQFISTLNSIGPKRRIARSADIEKLKSAVIEGAPLHAGLKIKTNKLRDFSRSWRKLIACLGLPASDPERMKAEELLKMLGVHHWKGIGNVRFFQLVKS